MSDIEICIGFTNRFNSPYSNSISPVMPFHYRAMILELNKKTYMTKSGDLDLERSCEVVAALREVYSFILGTSKPIWQNDAKGIE